MRLFKPAKIQRRREEDQLLSGRVCPRSSDRLGPPRVTAVAICEGGELKYRTNSLERSWGAGAVTVKT